MMGWSGLRMELSTGLYLDALRWIWYSCKLLTILSLSTRLCRKYLLITFSIGTFEPVFNLARAMHHAKKAREEFIGVP